jgi:hypothetical protein
MKIQEKMFQRHRLSEAAFNIQQLLKLRITMREENLCHRSLVHQLTCFDCGKKHIGQTGKNFEIKYKENL